MGYDHKSEVVLQHYTNCTRKFPWYSKKKKKKFQVAARKQKINQAPTIHISSKILPIYTYAFMQP